jgi:LPS export ABC transporter permease LptG/LPS export ABC transporter permease LptF
VFRVIDRYILREHLAPFALSIALLTLGLLLDRIYQMTDLVITRGVPFHLVLGLLFLMLPSFLAHTLPMALLVSILLAGGRLASDWEIVAFRASGVGPLRLLRPVIVAGALLSLVTLGLTLVVIPRANQAFQTQLFKTLETRATSGINERIFNTLFGDTVIYVNEISPSQVALKGLVVSDERDPKMARIITAREGRLLADPEARRITLRLIDGSISESEVGAATPASPATTDGAPSAMPRSRYTAFGLYDMNLSVQTPFKGAPRSWKPEKSLTVAELAASADAAPDARAAAPFRIELQKRWALPFAALAFAVIGFPLAAGSVQRGRGLALVASLAVLATYYLVMSSLEGQALAGQLPVWLAIWLPNLLTIAAGAGLMVYQLAPTPSSKAAWAGRALRRRLSIRSPRFGPRPLVERRPRTSRDSTHLIDRYLVRTYLIYFGLTVLVAATLFVVIDLLDTLDRYLRHKPPLRYIVQHFVYRLPVGVHDRLHIVTLVATVFVFLAMSRHHELTAMKAAGISLFRVSAPILALALLTSGATGLFQEFFVPDLNQRGDELDRVKILGMPPRHLWVRQRVWFRSTDTRFFRLDLVDPTSNEVRGLTVLEIDRDFQLLNRLDAARAQWAPEGWVLSAGALTEIDAGDRIQTIPFSMTAIAMPERFDDFTEIQRPVDQMSFAELQAYIQRLQASGYQVKKHLVKLYAKLSFPVAHLVMALVAIPLAVQAPRGGRLAGIGLAIGILAGYMLVDYSAVAFARADLLPPLMAAWTANIVFLGIAAALLLRART